MDRVIIHSDANCFYASVEMLYHPEFAGKPLAVGGDPEARCNLRRAAVADAFSGGRPALMNGC